MRCYQRTTTLHLNSFHRIASNAKAYYLLNFYWIFTYNYITIVYLDFYSFVTKIHISVDKKIRFGSASEGLSVFLAHSTQSKKIVFAGSHIGDYSGIKHKYADILLSH